MKCSLHGFRRALAAILAGMLVGRFGAIMVVLGIAVVDPLIWLGAVTVGAVGGGCSGVCVILWNRRAGNISNRDA